MPEINAQAALRIIIDRFYLIFKDEHVVQMKPFQP